jgi:Bacterial Ig-like domain (group 2)
MMTQQVISDMRSNGQLKPDTDVTCVGVVSLAAPLSSPWQTPSEWVTGYAVTGDIILTLGTNQFPQVTTLLTNQAQAAIADANLGWAGDKTGLTAAYRALLTLAWGVRIHSLDKDYMIQSASVTQFQQDAVLTYQGCALLDLTVYPYQAPINQGATVVYRTLMYNGLNEIDIINRKVAWSSSDSTIATVDTLGNVTAVSPGTAWIRAVYGIKADSGMASVVTSGGVNGNGGWCAGTTGPVDQDGSRLDGNPITPTGGYCQ